MDAAIEAWRGLGVTFVDIDLGDVERSHELMAFKVLLADAYNIHRERLETRPKDFGDDVYARAMLGKQVTGAEYAAALRWREVFCQRLRATFRDVDAILTPTTPESAPVAVANKDSSRLVRRVSGAFPSAPTRGLLPVCLSLPFLAASTTPGFPSVCRLRRPGSMKAPLCSSAMHCKRSPSIMNALHSAGKVVP